MDIEVRICGIPAIVQVTHFEPPEPASLGVHAPSGDLIDPGHPGADPVVEYTVLDRRGRPAPWLERKVDDAEDEAIVEQILTQLGAGRPAGAIGPTVRR